MSSNYDIIMSKLMIWVEYFDIKENEFSDFDEDDKSIDFYKISYYIYEYNCIKPNLQEESSILQNFKSSLKAQYIN